MRGAFLPSRPQPLPGWSPFLGPVRLAGVLPQRRMGIGPIAAFPNIQNVPLPGGGNTGDVGFKLQGLGQGIGLSVGGVALTYVSRFLPGIAETAAMIGGLGLLGFGVYKSYNVLSGGAEPQVEKFHADPTTPADALSNLSGKILIPTQNGQAELSSKWTAIFDSQRTFKIKFVVSNNDPDPKGGAVQALAEFNTEQVSRPWVGEPEISNFSTSYVIDDLGPGDSKVIQGFQPTAALENPLQPQAYRSQDVTATLLVRIAAKGKKKQLDKITFTAW
jgi:hypothetical protein